MCVFLFHIFRQKQLNEQNFDYILNWREYSSKSNHIYGMDRNAFAANETMMTNSNRKIGKQSHGMEFTETMQHIKYRKPHTGLLRRRHSLPEIIMRK